ncbi:calcium-binding protein [Niveispirillum sp. BGYR6]|uniref:calcium-binding protein n=1 Tax=Niveispirillum sp. BGYR6 TaxID=2971249 RepID=UPI0022B9451B|nr:calcium-binding protein [Niveispirillum sp. BGYR6]MDG5497700.1 calcium-binding protein [Niveispirillum sp. BGYR6]
MDIYGTSGNDTLRATSKTQRLLGGDGADTLEAGNYLMGTVLIGGRGSDTYSLVRGHVETVLVLENGGDPGDRWMDDGFLYYADGGAIVDGRHLLILDLTTGQAVAFLDWQRPENVIENWRVGSASTGYEWLTFEQFKQQVFNHPGFVGNVQGEILGVDVAVQLRKEIEQHYRAAANSLDPNSFDSSRQMMVNNKVATPYPTDGSFGLQWSFAGSTGNDVIKGTTGNDLINALEGNDAVDSGLGDDVIDGGRGSNFLTGGAGSDKFFVDGRGVNGANGTTVWSTVTDFTAGENVTIWGWRAGVSRVVETVRTGTAGFEGATWHIDLTGDGRIDASVTLTGVAVGQVNSTTGLVEGNGYLLLG